MATGKLLRVLGAGFGVAVIVGNTIGAGILRTPGDIARSLPNEWLFLGVWVLGGLYALIGSVSIAELGAMIPKAGGQYVFAQRALGRYAGFVVGWSDWLSTCGTTAAVSIVVGEYAGRLYPAFADHGVGIAFTTAVGFALIQWHGVRWGGRTQEITSLLKALAFLALIAACFLLGGAPREASGDSLPMASGLALVAALVIALQSVIYTYDGWAGVVYFSEEIRDPGREIPRATFLGVYSVMAIYVLMNLALLYVLPIERIAGAEFAAGVATTSIVGPVGEQVIRGLVILSMMSGINAYHLMATRTLFAMSRDGLFHRSAETVNEGGTPTVALFISTLVAVGFLLSGTFEEVIAILAFFFVTNYILSFVSVFVLRYREPQLERPYRAWGYPWSTGLSLLGALAFVVGAIVTDTRRSLFALLLLAVSYPVYRLIGLSRSER